ncbi:hypothetical protein NDU88_007286 [Pleurodeles waltl]|uniref:Uncharacterized protein n=1 Tax=Pleurodeles waltl TaxID=8319 RepID=A0AAV7RUG0_PLEWA|nr:hypothetical protein NDU88_007286 [Pleurodeles waltl]
MSSSVRPLRFGLRWHGPTSPVMPRPRVICQSLLEGPRCSNRSPYQGSEVRRFRRTYAALWAASSPSQMSRLRRQSNATPPPGRPSPPRASPESQVLRLASGDSPGADQCRCSSRRGQRQVR